MSSRGLPGFLRRSRRWNDFDDEDEDNDGDEEQDDAGDHSSNNNYNQAAEEKQRQYQKKQQQGEEDVMESTFTASLQFLDPSPLAESSAKEDGHAGYNTNANGGGANGHNHDGEDDDDEGYHSGGNRSVSTLGDIDPPTPQNSAFGGSRSSSSNNITTTSGGPTYRQIQFEKILSNNVVKLSELRKVSWNGIPVSIMKESVYFMI